jgi:hypothetical protein
MYRTRNWTRFTPSRLNSLEEQTPFAPAKGVCLLTGASLYLKTGGILSRRSTVLEVHLYGKLRRFADNQNPAQDSIIYVPVGEEETIEDIVERIGIPHDEIGSNVFLNGEYSAKTRQVRAGDRLGIFPDDMQVLYKWYFRKAGGGEMHDRD